MKKSFSITLLITLVSIVVITVPVRAQSETRQVMEVLHDFFKAVSSSDSVAFQRVFFQNAHMFVSRSVNDSVVYTSRSALKSPIFKPGVVYRETMRDKSIKIEIHKDIAMAWVPYDFYINNGFSHCGIDVFTLMKTEKGWKIALIAYTVEKSGCEDW
jgi:hypothetical protein